MSNIDKTKELGVKPIGQLLWTYALPSVLTMIISSIYNMADRMFIGQGVGAMAIAGLAITMPIMAIVNAFGALVGVGASARMSIVLGKKDYNWAENILGNSLVLTIVLGAAVLSVAYTFMGDILTLFGATQETISYAKEYLEIVLPGMFFTMITLNLTNLIRATGYPRKSMYIMGSGAILNMCLDPLFIFYLDMGIRGAAWATTISMVFTTIFAVWHFTQKTSFIRFKSHAWSPKFYIFRNILLIGMSPFLMNVASSGVVAMLNSQLIRYGGDLAVGVYGITNTYGAFLVMFIIGVCQGMQPIAGYCYGAGLTERLKGIYTLTMKVNVLVGCLGTLACIFIPWYMMRAFATDEQMIQMGIPALRYMTILFPLIGLTITNSNFFQSIDKPWIAIVTSLSRQVLFLAPMAYIVPEIYANMGQDGLSGIWCSCTVSDFLGAVLAISLLYNQRKIFSIPSKAA